MFQLFFALFRLLPWWAYAFLALSLSGSAAGLWESAEARVAAAERAIAQGLPAARQTTDLNTRTRNDTFQEMRIDGVIRADLGVGQLEGTVPKSYIVIDAPDRTGPVVAVMFVGSAAQAGLSDLVAQSDGAGRVIAHGFRRTLDWAAVSGQLRLRDVRREVILIEAIVGDRATVLRDKASGDKPFAVFVWILALGCTVAAYVRFSRWRKRRGAGRTQRPPVTASPVTASPDLPMPVAAQVSSPSAARGNGASPWATGVKTTAATFADPTVDNLPESPQPDFVSVFPGGGSGFRFKSADDIIRETFGTVSKLDRAKPKD